ncbi:hypothetical protein CTI12_AA279840 [Artemisia annua]|uniref:Uncharacterized protein n=1 Tax=Artemisia annua TaxID=35608 RepID=A0A2U1NDJ3_ARTAN|nr:hypothetical protein CTI12_AA279840 [Artemisia annua]
MELTSNRLSLDWVTDLHDQLAQHQEDQYASAADAYEDREALRDQLEIARARITELEGQGAGMRQEITELRESIQHERHMRGRLADQRILDRTRIATLERTAEEAQSR